MKIKATVTFEYTLNDSEIEEFKSRVTEYIQENLDEDFDAIIAKSFVEEFLEEKMSDILTDYCLGYDDGITIDEYFRTIHLDYCSETISDLVAELAELIIAD
jgi:hypothetical protein